MKRRRVVYLEDNMLDDNELVIFQADVPYVLEGNLIINEDNFGVHISNIWVDFRLVHQEIR